MIIRALANIYEENSDPANLSKAMDIVLCVDGNNKKLCVDKALDSPNLYFAVSLAILLAKREFFHLEQWLVKTVSKQGSKFVEAVLAYIERTLLSKIRGTDRNKAKEVLEGGHLDVNSLSVIFDKLISQDSDAGIKLDSPLGKKITGMYKEISAYFSNFAKLKSIETERETNELLTRYYNKEIDIDVFMDIMVEYKSSDDELKKEIFSCFIHNIFSEFGHGDSYPTEKLELTGMIFG